MTHNTDSVFMNCRDVGAQRAAETLRRATSDLEDESVGVEADDYFHPSIYKMFAGDNALDKISQLQLLRKMSVQEHHGDKFILTVGHLGSSSDKVPLVSQERQRLSKEREEMSE